MESSFIIESGCMATLVDLSSVARAVSPFSKSATAFWGQDVVLSVPGTCHAWLQL